MVRGRVESRFTREKAAAARAKEAGDPSGISGGLDGRVPTVSDEDVTHQLRQAGTPVGISDLEKAQAAAARRSSGVVESHLEKMSPLVGAAQAVAARGSP